MAENLEFQLKLDASAVKNQLEGLKGEFADLSQSIQSSFNAITKDKVKVDVEFNAETQQLEASIKRTTTAEEQLERAITRARNEQERQIKAAQKAKEEAAKREREEKKLTEELKKQAMIMPGSLIVLERTLKIEKEKLTFLKRGTAEFEKQAALVKKLEGAKRIEQIGVGGVQRENFQGLVDSFNRITFAAQQAASIVKAFANSFDVLFEAQAKLQSFQLSFEAIGAGATGANKALSESNKIALSLGADINAVRDGFQRLSPVILQSGGSLNDVSAVVQSLSSRFAVFGKTADESKRIMNAVVQAFGKGKLMSEELNQQISEADPAFRVDLANAIGVSVTALGEMVKNGELTNDVLLKAIPLMDRSGIVMGKFGDSAASAALALGQTGVTLSVVENQINNINQLNLEKLGTLFKPLLGAIVLVQAAIADLARAVTSSPWFAVLANLANGAAVAFAGLTLALTKAIEVVLLIISPIGELARFISEIGPLATGLGAIIGGVLAAALVKTVLGFGLVQLAITETIQGFRAFGQSVLFVTGPIKNLIVTIGQNAAELYKLGGAKLVARAALADIAFGFTALKTAAIRALASINAFILANPILLALAITVGGLALAWKDYENRVKKAKEVNEESKESIKKLSEALRPLKKDLEKSGDSWEGAVSRVGKFSAVLDGFAKDQRLVTSEQRSYYYELEATNKTIEEYISLAGRQRNAIIQNAQAAKGNADEIKRAQTAYETQSKALEDEIQKRQAVNLATRKTGVNSEAARQAKLQLIAAQQQGIAELQKELALLNSQAQAVGLVTSKQQENAEAVKEATKELTTALKDKINLVKEDGQATVQSLQDQKSAITERYQSEIAKVQEAKEARSRAADEAMNKLQSDKEAMSRRYEDEITKIQNARDAAKNSYEARISAIESEKSRMNSRYDAEIEKLRQIADLKQQQADIEIARLEQLTPAEQRLAAARESELRAKASGAQDPMDRLQAQAQLERMAREKQIAEVRRKAALEQERIEKEIAMKQKMQAEEEKRMDSEIAAIKDEAKKQDLAFEQLLTETKAARQQEERKFEDEIKAQKLKNKLEEIAVEDNLTKLKADQKSKEKAFDEQIQSAKRKNAQEVRALEAQVTEAKRAGNDISMTREGIEKRIVTALALQTEELRKQAALRGQGGGLLPARFAGGPVSGGSKYTVNELGQEAFLSNSGKLSMINAPSWGAWRAPSAGTVIPAHITAGLNIPKGGVPVKASPNSGAVSRGASGSPWKALQGALAGSGGRITNNVTIQSAKPVQDASAMLVEMSKMRIRRR